MASKKPTKTAAADVDVDELFKDLEEETKAPAAKGGAPSSKVPKGVPSQTEEDLFADLEKDLEKSAQPVSRPHTPRIQQVKRSTPPPGSTRTSEEKPAPPRKSGESTRSFHTSFTPSATSSELQEAEKKSSIAEPAEKVAETPATGGGWWGSLTTVASAALKTAEAAVKEVQQNEEAKRWAEQVKGNVGALKGFGSWFI
jgi:hypothetical protein